MRRTAVAVSLFAIAASGCDQIKSLAGGNPEGGTSSSTLGSLFDKDFVGEVSMTMKASKPKPETMNMVIGVARPSYRMDIADPTGPKGAVILDLTTKKGWFLIPPPQKMAMEIDFNQPVGARGVPGLGGAAPRGAPAAPSSPPTITKTGQKETVAGYVCDDYSIATSDGRKTLVCMAENLTWFNVSEFGMQSPELAAAAAFTDANHFPLRAVSYDPKGVEEMRLEATKIDKKSLPPSDFTPPPDYKVVNMATMMQGGIPGQPGQPGIPPGKH
jgi:hypothetical protein